MCIRDSALEVLNEKRKELQKKIFDACKVEAIRQIKLDSKCIVIASDDFHPGINGLVAQNIAQTFERPCFIFFKEKDLLKGSARSFGKINLLNILNASKDILIQFGGHPQAGGGSLHVDDLEQFKKNSNAVLNKLNIEETQKKYYDEELALKDINEALISSLNELGPYGLGNTEPLFLIKAKGYGQAREVGSNHLKAAVCDDEGNIFNCIGFNMWNAYGAQFSGKVKCIVKPQINVWQGRREVQLLLIDILN